MVSKRVRVRVEAEAGGAKRSLDAVGRAAEGMGRKTLAAGRDMRKAARDAEHLERQAKKTKATLSGLGAVAKRAFLGIAAYLGASKIVDVTTRQQNALNQLEAAVRSTGGAAGQTVPQLAAFAAEMQKITTYGDEAVMEMQGVLLTFTKIGGDVFPRATKAILDMATRLKMDLKSAALQVGKALNDPVLGVSALARAGIQFTESQKEMIKGLVETGQVAKAQAVILKELEVQFGGSAEAARNTLGGALEALSNAFWDFFEIGQEGAKPLVAIINLLADNIGNLLRVVLALGAAAVPAMFARWARSIGVATRAMRALTAAALANPFVALATVIAGVVSALYLYRDTMVEISGVTASIGDWVVAAWEVIGGGIKDAVMAAYQAITEGGNNWLATVRDVVSWAWEAFKWAFDQILAGARAWLNATIGVFMALGEVVSGVVETIPALFSRAFDRVTELAGAFWRGFKAMFTSGDFGFDEFRAELVKGFSVGLTDAAKEIGSRVEAALTKDYVGAAIGAVKELGSKIKAQAAKLAEVRDRAKEAGKALQGMARAGSAAAGETLYMIDGVLMTLDQYAERLKFTTGLQEDALASLDQLPQALKAAEKEQAKLAREGEKTWAQLRDGAFGFLGTLEGATKQTFGQVLAGEFSGLGDLWASTLDRMASDFLGWISTLLTELTKAGLKDLFAGLFGGQGGNLGNLLGGLFGGGGGSGGGGLLGGAGALSSAWGAIKGAASTVAGWFGLGGTSGVMGGGMGGAMTQGLANLGIGGAAGAGGGGGTGAATAGLAAGLAGPGLAFGMALGPGLLGMGLSQMGFLMDGPMTPEEAISNWKGQERFIQTLTARMQELGQTVEDVSGDFGLFGRNAREMAGDFKRLGTVAGYTEDQLEAVRRGLSPMAQQMLASGEAANTLADSVQGLVAQISAERDSYTLTTPVVNDYNERIDKLAVSIGLTGNAADQFRGKIWELSRTFTVGGEEAWGFGNSLDQFVAQTLSTITDAASGTTEAIRNLIDSMNGVPGAARNLPGVDDLGLSTGGGYDPMTGPPVGGMSNADLGYYHRGGWPGGLPRFHAGHMGDEYLALLQRGESVIRRSSVNRETAPVLDHINRTGRVPQGDTIINLHVHGLTLDDPDTLDMVARRIDDKLTELEARRH